MGWTPRDQLEEARPRERGRRHNGPPTPGVQAYVLALTKQIAVLSGQRAEVYRIKFSYQGPAREIVVGWALKPRPSGFFSFGIDWNNGNNTYMQGRAFSPVLKVPNTPIEQVYDTDVSLPLAAAFGFFMPPPGSYPLTGGDTGSFGEGGMDTWIWVTDITAIKTAGLSITPQSMMDERFLLAIDTDANSLNLQAATKGFSNLQVAYRTA